MKLLNDSGYLTGWLKVQTPAMVRFESKDNHRIMKWLMLEATSGGHLVQFPYSSKATRIGVPRTMPRWLLKIAKDGEPTEPVPVFSHLHSKEVLPDDHIESLCVPVCTHWTSATGGMELPLSLVPHFYVLSFAHSLDWFLHLTKPPQSGEVEGEAGKRTMRKVNKHVENLSNGQCRKQSQGQGCKGHQVAPIKTLPLGAKVLWLDGASDDTR